MSTNEHICLLGDKCEYAGVKLPDDSLCYTHTLAHGIQGDGGFYGASGIPKKYRNSFFENLPIKADNPQAYKVAEAYISNVLDYVEKGVGLFFYSVPNKDNPRGTGTGKTTTATAIGNEYIKQRIIQKVTGQKDIKHQPTLFVRVSELQNTYNKQFRGSFEDQEKASTKFGRMLKKMENAELLILDDISLRSSTEPFTNILYEMVDKRDIEEKPIIYTSNFPVDKLPETLDHQTTSRVEGTTEQIAFKGTDHRKGGIL
ncbi:ATP-binding protein [Halobacillus karajensis]|uniref:ATP-binding protein n=1 Tax=Halobacillus karajensis TaxID=195088 RepID=UPI00045C7E24|nr:ATP-binding protein [Halobacillus karajensis]CDQ21718.1 DNA replication protein DnaC [Halobacillus karajensis]